MNDEFKRIGFPLLFIGTFWGAGQVFLAALKMINERRDLILQLVEECGNCAGRARTPLLIYWTNLAPLSVGVCIFALAITIIIIVLPTYLYTDDAHFARKVRRMSTMFSSLPLFVSLGFLGGALFDFFTIVIGLP